MAVVNPAAQHRAGDEATVGDRFDCLGAGPEGGAGLDGPVGDHGVEVAPAHHVSVRRVVGMLRPGQLEGDAVGDRAQALEAQVRLELVGEAEVLQLADGAGGQPVPARLVAGELLAFDDEDPVACLGQPARRGGTGGATPDDQHVESVASAHRRPSCHREPRGAPTRRPTRAARYGSCQPRPSGYISALRRKPEGRFTLPPTEGPTALAGLRLCLGCDTQPGPRRRYAVSAVTVV